MEYQLYPSFFVILFALTIYSLEKLSSRYLKFSLDSFSSSKFLVNYINWIPFPLKVQRKDFVVESSEPPLPNGDLQEKLTNRLKDLTNLSIELQRKEELLALVVDKINQMKLATHEVMVKELEQLERLLLNQGNIKDELSILQANINQVGQEFYQNLSKKFPNLNQNERNLCGLIRLGYTNKEIALLKNVTVKAAKMARYRIRKKFDLSANEDVVVFLQNI